MGIFFYNSTKGVNRLYNVDDHGQLSQVGDVESPSALSLGSGWTHIVPCSLTFEQLPYMLMLLCYKKDDDPKKDDGTAKFFSLDPKNKLTPLTSTTLTLSKWTHIIHGAFGQAGDGGALLFYNATSGKAHFYSTDGRGNIKPLSKEETYDTGWTHIVPGQYTGKGTSDLLFYNSSSGRIEFYGTQGVGTQGQGGMTPISDFTPKDFKGWTHILSGNFVAGNKNASLFFYNATSGLAQFYTTDGKGIKPLLPPNTKYDIKWAQIVGFPGPGEGNPDRLLFYNSGEKGSAKIYAPDNREKGGIKQLSNYDVGPDWSQAVWLANTPKYYNG